MSTEAPFEAWLRDQPLPMVDENFSLPKIEALLRSAWNAALTSSPVTVSDEGYKALMAAGDERSVKAASELERARLCRDEDEDRKAKMADNHAWALRNQASGLWEAAHIIAALSPTPTDQQQGSERA